MTNIKFYGDKEYNFSESEAVSFISYLRNKEKNSALAYEFAAQLAVMRPDIALGNAEKIGLATRDILPLVGKVNDSTAVANGLKTYISRYEKEADNLWTYQNADDHRTLINFINKKEANRAEIDENNLSSLKGLSLDDIKSDDYSKVSRLAAKAYDTSHLSGLLQVASEAPGTPAADLISARYREKYGDEVVNGITERAEEIIKLPYKAMFFRRIKDVSEQWQGIKEANFLDAFTDKIRSLAMTKYGQKDRYDSISEAGKNPEFMKEADAIWNEMIKDPEKYASLKPNYHDNAYIRKMFAGKIPQLHDVVSSEKPDFGKVLDEAIEYHKQVGKMLSAIKEYSKDNGVYFNGDLHFDIVDAGVKTKKEAKRCLDIWQVSNERPDRYGSPYNNYTVKQIAQIAKSNVMQDWMYPVMMDAVEAGGLTLSQERIPSERTLFDCCKMWKISPFMPQRLAEFTGSHSLKNRMLAGAIFDKMNEYASADEWHNNKELLGKFYGELSRAEKMPVEKAFKKYIPDTPVNRKRLVGMGLEEKGIEITKENFRNLYSMMRKNHMFEKMLARPEEAASVSKLLVEASRRKFNKSR